MIRAKNNKNGFSLIETLVASAILSGAVLTLGAISTMSVTGTRINRRYEVAASLLDKQLNMIDYIGIDEFIDIGQMEGDFEGYEPAYHWKVLTEYQDIDSLYLVTITVSWADGNRPYSISADTMLDGVSVYLEVEVE
ncbi:MAG: prepilin-type N-terminal cleavage/methylation domain-containing protein [Planctomycetes bacterium]|nr:prepilin-type N-terminal cleavage/methylation domain-containing protein [Planctomycetota bacterium]MBL7146905.1 prepilin-type N-terminal cleavage/methylation domain-containing protein [Phycisphaerae bacterium]